MEDENGYLRQHGGVVMKKRRRESPEKGHLDYDNKGNDALSQHSTLDLPI